MCCSVLTPASSNVPDILHITGCIFNRRWNLLQIWTVPQSSLSDMSVWQRVFPQCRQGKSNACIFATNKTTDNPLQINPIEASGAICFLKSISCIANTSILLQPSRAEISSQWGKTAETVQGITTSQAEKTRLYSSLAQLTVQYNLKMLIQIMKYVCRCI